MIKEQKAIEKNERNRLPQDSSMHSSAKEVHIKKRDVDVGDQFNMKQEEGDVNKYEQEKLKQRMSPPLTKSTLTKKEADDEFDRVRKDNTSSIRGRGDRRSQFFKIVISLFSLKISVVAVMMKDLTLGGVVGSMVKGKKNNHFK
jgi:hypothetical protein